MVIYDPSPTIPNIYYIWIQTMTMNGSPLRIYPIMQPPPPPRRHKRLVTRDKDKSRTLVTKWVSVRRFHTNLIELHFWYFYFLPFYQWWNTFIIYCQPRHDSCKSFSDNMLPCTMKGLATNWKLNLSPGSMTIAYEKITSLSSSHNKTKHQQGEW